MEIIKVTKKEFADWVKLGTEFWPKHSEENIRKDFARMIKSRNEQSFLYKHEGKPVAFMNVAIRTDYVEGSTTTPVGYLEGVYVKKAYRNQGIAKMLFAQAKKWLKAKRVKEIGSDAQVKNIASQKFHKSLGFKKGETIVHFIKQL